MTMNKKSRTPEELLQDIILGDKATCIVAINEARAMYAGIPSAAVKAEGCEEKDLRNAIRRLMTEIGVPAALKGYRALEEAIYLAVKDPESAELITKRIYPEVAKKLGDGNTGSRVERSIRHGVEVAMERGDLNVINRIFGGTMSYNKGKPTNGEFIAQAAIEIRLRMGM